MGRILKASVFVVQKATAQKNMVEFCQGSIGAVRLCCTMRGTFPYTDLLSMYVKVIRMSPSLYNVARLHLTAPIEPWQNSTPFLGAAALCTTEMDVLGPL